MSIEVDWVKNYLWIFYHTKIEHDDDEGSVMKSGWEEDSLINPLML